MKTFEAKFNKKQTAGVYGISLVENPAMQGLFIALAENEVIQFAEVDAEKRLICGLVLRSNFPVFRKGKDGSEDYQIVFSDETIKDLAHNFYENNHQSNSSIEHFKKIEGVTFVESWIVESPEQDKTTALKLESQKGDWFTIMKIENDTVWNDFTKTGKVKGFSIDAMLELEEINFKNEDMDVSKIVDAIKNGFASLSFGSVKSADESVTIEFDGDTMTVGGDVWVLDGNGEKVPLPVGEYQIEEGKTLVVNEVGKIGEVKEAVVEEEAPAEPTPEQPMSDAKQSAEIATAVENAIKSIMIKYSNEVAELKAQILELSKEPATKPIVNAPSQIEFSKMTSKERISTLINKNKK